MLSTSASDEEKKPPPKLAYLELRYDQIDPDLNNLRESLPNLESLAQSIAQHGLLENLVGRLLLDHEKRDDAHVVRLAAGSRRLAAIGMLIERGVWPEEQTLTVAILEGDGYWQRLNENLQREDAMPWEIGRKLAESASAGLHHKEIGYRVGKSQGYVSRYIHIGTGLSPEVIRVIRERKLDLQLNELARIAMIKNKWNEPDGPAQVEALDRQKRRKSPTRRSPDDLRAFALRINYLESTMPVPQSIRPIVGAIIEYLRTGGKPNFRALADGLLKGNRVQFEEPEEQ